MQGALEIMVRNPRIRRAHGVAALALVTSLGLGLAACGGDDDSTSSGTTAKTERVAQQVASSAPSATSKAAELRAGLTNLLEEHVYLAGIATGTALSGGDLKPAADALDENSVALSDAIKSVYGDAAAQTFLGLWRTHIGFFVDYTNAVATGDDAAKQKAIDDLTGYTKDFSAFLAGANPKLDQATLAEGLKMHAETLFAAIDAQAAKDPSQYTKLRAAAQHMPDFAKILADGIVQQFPEKFTD
jgi:hypothetical protein